MLKQRDKLVHQLQKQLNQGLLDEAAVSAKEKLSIEHKVFGERHEFVVATWSEPFGIHLDRKDFPAAETAQQKIAVFYGSLYGENNWKTLEANWTATEVSRQAKWSKVQWKLQTESMRLNAAVSREYARGNYFKAGQLSHQIVDLCKRLYTVAEYPHGHPEIATSLNNLGVVLASLGDYAQAQLFYEQALTMRRNIYSADLYLDGHPNLAESLERLGSVLVRRQKHVEAQSLLEQALKMREKIYSRDHYPDGHTAVAESLCSLGDLLEQQGKYVDAQVYLARGLKIYEKLFADVRFPDGQRVIAETLRHLGGIFRQQGKLLQAHQLRVQCWRRSIVFRHAEISTAARGIVVQVGANAGGFLRAKHSEIYQRAIHGNNESDSVRGTRKTSR